MKLHKQKITDSRRKVYVITLPSDLTEDRIRAFLRSISGSLDGKRLGFFDAPSIVFETWADDFGITYRLLVPPSDASFILQHLESMIPGTYAELDDTRPENVQWSEVAEISMTRSHRPLTIPVGTDLAHSILTSLQALEGEQTILIQWVIAPMKPEPMPRKGSVSLEAGFLRAIAGKTEASDDEVAERRKKLESPNFLSVGRVAVAAQPEHARRLTHDVLKSLAAASTGSNKLRGAISTTPDSIAAANLASTPWRLPAQVSTDELSSLISWSMGRPYITGLPGSRTRIMHVPRTVATGGEGSTVIGVPNGKGKERDIAIESVDMLKHVHIMGPTESGKTSLAANMAEQTMKNGSGLVLIETKGDLFRAILERVPPERKDHVIVWDGEDIDTFIGFNFLHQRSSRKAIDEALALIGRLFPESGVLTTGPLYHGLHALAEHPGGTLIDLMVLIDPRTPEQRAWREELIAGLKRRDIKRYWEDHIKKDAAIQAREAEPLKRRMWQFMARAEIRNTLGQSRYRTEQLTGPRTRVGSAFYSCVVHRGYAGGAIELKAAAYA